MKRLFSRLLSALLLLAATSAAFAQVTVTPDHPAAIYHAGETVHWSVAADKEGPATADYQVKRNGLDVVQKGTLDFAKGPQTIDVRVDAPGALLLQLAAPPAAGQGRPGRILAGVLIDPQKIEPTLPPPADFQDFWKQKIAQLHAIPANPQLQPADSGRPDVDYLKLQMDTIEGAHIHGQLARPHADGKYPALLILQWAGVYGLPSSNVVNRARQGWLTLNIEPHDLPFDQPPEFYKQAADTTLKDYYHRGNADREKSYFLRMYLSAYRAADYLASRDDWDGKTLVVMGTSMGGQQTLITAGLHPKVTAALALVPSSCDAAGPTAGRAAGFPDWAAQASQTANPQILDTSRYFDPENFARTITCPALVGLGLIDETCPPAGVYAAFNQLHGPREAGVLIHSDHSGRNNTQAAFNQRAEEWLAALVHGNAPPVK